MYTMTVLSFFVGACIGCVSVYTYGAYGAFIGFVPLIVARLFMYIGKIPVENGTPEETEEEAKAVRVPYQAITKDNLDLAKSTYE